MPLVKIIIRRVLLGVLTLFLVSVLVFAATQALPGDTARAILGKSATPATLKALRQQLDLDRPAVVQYARGSSGVVKGNLGNSLAAKAAGHQPHLDARAQLGIPRAARRPHQHPALDPHRQPERPAARPRVRLGHVARQSGPGGAARVRHRHPAARAASPRRCSTWLPAVSRSSSRTCRSRASSNILILPAPTLVLAVSPYIMRILRASMVEVLESDYVQMARLKGMPERIVLRRHALPNAIIPAIQVIALNLAWLAGGVVVVEYVFNYPGIGSRPRRRRQQP